MSTAATTTKERKRHDHERSHIRDQRTLCGMTVDQATAVHAEREECTITTPFDMTVLNDMDRFHLVMDTVDRVPPAGDKGIALKKQLQEKLIEHKRYIDKNGQDLPEIRNWKWGLNHA